MNKQDLIDLNEHIQAFDLTSDLTQCTYICEGIIGILRNALPEEPEWDTAVEDAGIKFLWRRLGDVAIDDNECIDSSFYIWPEGTPREEIWRWFDVKHSKGVAHLMGIAD